MPAAVTLETEDDHDSGIKEAGAQKHPWSCHYRKRHKDTETEGTRGCRENRERHRDRGIERQPYDLT